MGEVDQQDQSIIDGALAGGAAKTDATGRLYIRYKEEMTRQILRDQASWIRQHPEIVEEIYADGVLAVIDNIVKDEYRGEGSLGGYLRRILKNLGIDSYKAYRAKKRARLRNAVPVDSLPKELVNPVRSAEDQLIFFEDREQLKRCLAKLSRKCQAILLRFAQGYSQEAIAEELGYGSRGSVKVTKHRCMEKLQICMKAK